MNWMCYIFRSKQERQILLLNPIRFVIYNREAFSFVLLISRRMFLGENSLYDLWEKFDGLVILWEKLIDGGAYNFLRA